MFVITVLLVISIYSALFILGCYIVCEIDADVSLLERRDDSSFFCSDFCAVSCIPALLSLLVFYSFSFFPSLLDFFPECIVFVSLVFVMSVVTNTLLHLPDLGRFRIRSRNQRTNLNSNPDLIPDSDSCVVESD